MLRLASKPPERSGFVEQKMLSPWGRSWSLTEVEFANEVILPQFLRRPAFEGD